MRDKIFYSICFGFVLGVLLRSFFFIDFYFILLLAVISIALILFFSLFSINKWVIIAGIFILAFSLGIFRFNFADKMNAENSGYQVGQKTNFSGIIVDEPDIRENNQKLTILLADKVKILITADFNQNFKYGDKINCLGKLTEPKNFITDQGKEFDYVNYLRKDGIFYLANYPEIEIISHNNGNKIKAVLFSIKEKFLEKINRAISYPENLLMGGLILGEKSSFSESLRKSFVDTGTIHIVALSGYNVTIVAEWIMKLFKFLPINFGIGAGILTIILFVLMTGGSSTALRAGIMAVLMLFARATGRNYDAARALLLAGIVMILFNPFILAFDVSFQLSLIATIAVIFLAPRIEKYFMWITPKFELRDIVSVTAAAYILVAPFILYKMGNFSLVALPANILILPFIPLTMAFGFFTGLAGMIWHILAIPFGYISYFLLHYELAVVNFFANLHFASFSIPNFPLILTILIYIYFIYRIFGRSIKKFFNDVE